MSHFNAFVFTTEQPSDEKLAEILQPWHEFECTGKDDQYVIAVDQLAEKQAEFATAKTRRLRAPDGTLHEPWEDQFYREFTLEELAKSGRAGFIGSGWGGGISYHSKDWGDGRGHRAKAQFIPDGYVELEVPYKELMDFRVWLAEDTDRKEIAASAQPVTSGKDAPHKFGYTVVSPQGEVTATYDRTNPNAHWDWWQLGGRWSGMLRLKPGATVQPRLGHNGGAGGENPDRQVPGATDCAPLAQVDFEAIYAERNAEGGAHWDKAQAAVAGLPLPLTWEQVRDASALEGETPRQRMDRVRATFNAQPAVAALKEAFKDSWSIADQVEWLHMTREAVQAQRRGSFAGCFAYVLDGQWHERGNMGGFGIVLDEKDENAWRIHLEELVAKLRQTHWVTVVDCHI